MWYVNSNQTNFLHYHSHRFEGNHHLKSYIISLLHLLENMLAIMYKHFDSFCFFFISWFFFSFFLLSTIKDIMHRHIRNRKENTLITNFYSFENYTSFNLIVQMLHLTEHGFYDLHTGVHDWRVTVMKWLFMPLS